MKINRTDVNHSQIDVWKTFKQKTLLLKVRQVHCTFFNNFITACIKTKNKHSWKSETVAGSQSTTPNEREHKACGRLKSWDHLWRRWHLPTEWFGGGGGGLKGLQIMGVVTNRPEGAVCNRSFLMYGSLYLCLASVQVVSFSE